MKVMRRVVQSICGWAGPGSVRGQVGHPFDQRGVMERDPAYGRALGTRSSLRSIPTQTVL